MHSSATIREAQPGDEATILELIRELAVFEKLEHLLVATETEVHEAVFGPDSVAGCFLAEIDGTAIGYALWFRNYSSFLSRAGVYLEDIYVRPEQRGLGIGKGLLRRVAEKAVELKAGRLEWVVLDWNQGAIDFYESLGAQVLDEWRLVRMKEETIAEFAKGD